MGEDRFEMSQKERDRLKVLHEADKGQITQEQASEQLRVTERQVRRLIKRIAESRRHRQWCTACEVELRIDGSTAKRSGVRSRNCAVQIVMTLGRHSRPSMSVDGWVSKSAATRCGSG